MTEDEWLTAESPLPLLIHLRGKVQNPNAYRRVHYSNYGALVDGDSDAMPRRKVRLLVAALLQRLRRIKLDMLSNRAIDAYLTDTFFETSSNAFFSVCLEIQANRVSSPLPVISHFAAYRWSDDPLGAASASGDITCILANHQAAESVAVTCANANEDDWFIWGFCGGPPDENWQHIYRTESSHHADLIRDVIQNPFDSPARLHPLPGHIVELARRIYEDERFQEMDQLGAALQDARCTSDSAINHCLIHSCHVRGCWVLDDILLQS